jgi:hypothetical protein
MTKDLNPDLQRKLNAGIADMLGYTKMYLEKEISFECELPDHIVAIATEIALLSARLNSLSAKFDREICKERISQVQRKQLEWAEMLAKGRMERIAKNRQKIGKSLKGWEKDIWLKQGLLPDEFMEQMMDKMKAFLASQTKTK